MVKQVMTPKEKAQELVSKYIIYFPEFYDNEEYSFEYGYDEDKAKQCAMLLVDEILSIKPNNPFIVNGYYIEPKKYWEQVKQEILAL